MRFYGPTQPNTVRKLRVGGRCPTCGDSTRWTLAAYPLSSVLQEDAAENLIASYRCDACLGPIAVLYQIVNWPQADNPSVAGGVPLIERTPSFELEHVPEPVAREIREALDCLRVRSYNGFAALVRRATQALCTDLGATASTKVQHQITEMAEMSGLDETDVELAKQIMLTGHDGSHPHLPEVDEERAEILLALLGDLTYQLYTRPGNVRAAANLRKEAIERRREEA